MKNSISYKKNYDGWKLFFFFLSSVKKMYLISYVFMCFYFSTFFLLLFYFFMIFLLFLSIIFLSFLLFLCLYVPQPLNKMSLREWIRYLFLLSFIHSSFPVIWWFFWYGCWEINNTRKWRLFTKQARSLFCKILGSDSHISIMVKLKLTMSD